MYDIPSWYDRWLETDPVEAAREREKRREDYEEYLAEQSDLRQGDIDYD